MKLQNTKISQFHAFLRKKSLEEAGALELHQSYLSAEKEYRLEANKLRKIVSFVQSEIRTRRCIKKKNWSNETNFLTNWRTCWFDEHSAPRRRDAI